MIDRRLLTSFDWKFFGIICAILTLGVATIFSISSHPSPSAADSLWIRQICWVFLGLAAFFVMAFIDYHEIVRVAYVFYAIVIILLVLVLAVGRVGQGAQRWISVGPLSFQPSEISKLALLLLLARYFSERLRRAPFRIFELWAPGLLLLVPLALILKQPDLGTALVILFIFTTMILLVGLRSRSLIFGLLVGVMLLPFLWQFFWNHLKEYQKERLLTFLNPNADPLGTGYHIIQSKIAIGSGEIVGKGLLGGTQSQLKFLPEGHTDFIFAVFAEEWGFVGVVILLALYLSLILIGIEIAYRSKDSLGSLLASGIVCMITFYLLINIGMTMGVMPVVGIPLPLMSYGGTAMVTTMAALGLLMNIKLRRFQLFY
jgi:rod shape determining protein RodA